MVLNSCIRQDGWSYALITSNPQISVAYNNKGVFLTHATCLQRSTGRSLLFIATQEPRLMKVPFGAYFHRRRWDRKQGLGESLLPFKTSLHKRHLNFRSPFIGHSVLWPQLNFKERERTRIHDKWRHDRYGKPFGIFSTTSGIRTGSLSLKITD